MKKILLFSVIFLAMMSSIALATVSLDISWQAGVETLRPGGETIVSLTVSNTGTTALTNVKITPSGGPGITPTSGKVELGGIAALGTQQASITIRANEDAVSKSSYVYLDVDYYTGTSTYQKTFTIPISIKREPILQIVDVNYDDVVSPGNTLILSFDIRNSGIGPATDLVVTLNQSNLFTIPGSAGEIIIYELNEDETITMSYTITIDPDADIGINSVPVKLTYYDETKVNTYEDTKYIGMTVAGKIDFIINVDEAMGNMATISITNRGTASAEYLTIKAVSNGNEKDYYIGSLDSDDTETIEVENPRITGTYDLMLYLDYKDNFNNEYSEEKTISVKPSLKINSSYLLVLIIIGAGAYWYYKKKLKK